MRKLGMFLMAALALILVSQNAYAQKPTKEQKNAEKVIKKEAKQMKKEGWKVAPGNLTIELQLKESYYKSLERDSNGYDKYIKGEAMSTGESYDAALFQASNLAKLDLAGKLQTEVAELINNNISNKQLAQKQAASLAESVASSKSLVSQKLGRVITPVIMYRDLKNGNVEVRTVVYYSHEMAMDTYKQTIREDLEKKSSDLAKQLDEILGF